jgi:predicted esterase
MDTQPLVPVNVRSHHLTVRRTARYYTLGEEVPEVREVWLVCHGYGQLAGEFIGGFRALADGTRLVVAPEGLSRFYVQQEAGQHGPDSPVGATWMTREDRLAEIDDYVAYLDRLLESLRERLGPGPRRLVALGFSQGTATISRWAVRTEAHVQELVLWGGRLPPDLDGAAAAGRWEGVRVTLVAGGRDRWATERELEADAARLVQLRVAARVLRFEGGHRLDDETLRAIADELGAGPSR